MGGLSIFHWLILLLIIVILFGATKLPKIGEGLGQGIKAFRKEIKTFDEDDDLEVKSGKIKDVTPKKKASTTKKKKAKKATPKKKSAATKKTTKKPTSST